MTYDKSTFDMAHVVLLCRGQDIIETADRQFQLKVKKTVQFTILMTINM